MGVTDSTVTLVKAGEEVSSLRKRGHIYQHTLPVHLSVAVGPMRTLSQLFCTVTFCHGSLPWSSRGRGIDHHPGLRLQSHPPGQESLMHVGHCFLGGGRCPEHNPGLKLRGRRVAFPFVKDLRRQSAQLTQIRLSSLTDLLGNLSILTTLFYGAGFLWSYQDELGEHQSSSLSTSFRTPPTSHPK